MRMVILPYLLLLGYFFYLFWQARRAKKQQDEVLASLQNAPDIHSYHRVYVARAPFMKRMLKLLSFEGRGILLNKGDSVELHARLKNNLLVAERYNKSDLQVEWFGNKTIGSSNLHWLKLGSGDQSYFISADTGFNAVQSREATADIARQVFRGQALPAMANQDFALDKNPASLTAVIVMFCLIGFAVIDGGFVNQNQLVNAGPILRLLPVLYVLAIPCYWLLSRRQVPARESVVLSLLLGAALMVAAIPALKRVDQLLAGSGPQEYSYELRDGYRFYAQNSAAPELCFPRKRKYWSEFKEGSIHQFKLWHGPLGLWQLDDQHLQQLYRQEPDKPR